MMTLAILIIAILFIWLFSILCMWHCSRVETLEIKGDKDKLCETVKTVLVCYTMSVAVSLLFGTLFGITSDFSINNSSRALDVILLIFTMIIPLLALIAFIWMIVKEMMQINDGFFDSKHILSLVLITVLGISATGIGFISCFIKSLAASGFRG